MRCPKCHYLSFDPDPRCKNCGYDLDIDVETDETESADFELRIAPAPPAAAPDLPLRSEKIPARSVTLELVQASAPAAQATNSIAPPLPPLAKAPVIEPALALVGAAVSPEPTRRAPARSAASTTELPLFVKTMGPQELGAFAGLDLAEDTDKGHETLTSEETEGTEETERRATEDAEDECEAAMFGEPPVELPPAMRPLSVRRPVETTRSAPRIERRPGPLDNDLLEDLQRLEREEAVRARGSAASGWEDVAAGSDVAVSHRLGAAAFDGLLLGGIGAFVLWATLKVADASPSSLGAAALIPMAAFVAAVGVAYLLMFTAAGGQTVGKMLMGIRVVDDSTEDGDRLTLGQAAGRAVLAPLSVAMLGLGWLPAVFGRGQALHDRLVHTRVVRA